jgi:hypothetical protein
MTERTAIEISIHMRGTKEMEKSRGRRVYEHITGSERCYRREKGREGKQYKQLDWL